LDNKGWLLLIGGLFAVTMITLVIVLPEPAPATVVVITTRPIRHTATHAPHTTTGPAAATWEPWSTFTPSPPPPLAVATMVVGASDDPRVLVLIVTASPTPLADTGHRATAPTATIPARRASPDRTTFDTSPLPTPVSPLATPISPLPTPPAPSRGAMPDDATVQGVYELLDALIVAEGDYYRQHGHYAQLLLADGALCPEGQSCLTLDYPPGVLAGVDVYASPYGAGYEVHISVDGWRLTVAAGPESWRAEGWHYDE